jgi:hypothetical protein
MGIKSVCPMSQVLIKMIFGEMSIKIMTGRISSDKQRKPDFTLNTAIWKILGLFI